MVMISGITWAILVLLIFFVIGLITKKWTKVGYLLSGLLFLIGVILAVGRSASSFSGLQQVLILFGLGFLVNSAIGFFSKK